MLEPLPDHSDQVSIVVVNAIAELMRVMVQEIGGFVLIVIAIAVDNPLTCYRSIIRRLET